MGTGKILIVEDEDNNAAYLEIVLGHHGYSVAGIVRTGEEALELAARDHIDLLLMDIRLAGKVNGITAAECIIRTTGIPVIFVSAYAAAEMITQALATGAHDFVVKPYKMNRILHSIATALNKGPEPC